MLEDLFTALPGAVREGLVACVLATLGAAIGLRGVDDIKAVRTRRADTARRPS